MQCKGILNCHIIYDSTSSKRVDINLWKSSDVNKCGAVCLYSHIPGKHNDKYLESETTTRGAAAKILRCPYRISFHKLVSGGRWPVTQRHF